MAARVTRVLGGGLMEVVGARETRVNGETQIVLVQGVARDRDIDADNTIMSTSLAEARIELYGEGVLADKQRPGGLRGYLTMCGHSKTRRFAFLLLALGLAMGLAMPAGACVSRISPASAACVPMISSVMG